MGNVLRFAIPDDTFRDPEDGDTSNLQLDFLTIQDGHGVSVSPESWIQLNRTSRTLFGLPLRDDVGMHRYQLMAGDSGGEFATMVLTVEVTGSRVEQRLSHEFSVLVDIDYRPFLYKVSLGHAPTYLSRFMPAFPTMQSVTLTLLTSTNPGYRLSAASALPVVGHLWMRTVFLQTKTNADAKII